MQYPESFTFKVFHGWGIVLQSRINLHYIFIIGNINDVQCRDQLLRPLLHQLHDDNLQQGYFQQEI